MTALGAAAACSEGSPAFSTAPHEAYPEVPSAGGHVLAASSLVAVSFAGDSQGMAIAGFLSSLANSGWLPSALAEYGVQSVAYEGQVALDPLSSLTLSDVDLEALLAAKLGDATIPTPSGASPPFVYLVVVPAGVSITRSGNDACAGIPSGGYHDSFTSANADVPYAVVPSCDPPFSALLSQVAGMELEAARLIVDALTDPAPLDAPAYALTDPSNPWTSIGTEVGDLCWGRLTDAATPPVLQRVWSNQRIARGTDPCVPALAQAVSFGVTAAPSEVQVVHSQSAFTFAVSAWSASPLAPWTVQATPWLGDYPMTVTLDADTLANGQSTTLRVSLPDAVPVGSLGVVLLQAGVGGGDLPAWPVGFVVR